MPSLISREMSITYNNYTVGGDQANRILEDIYMVDGSYENGSVEFTFTVVHSTLAAFLAECVAAERAFRTPRKDLTVIQNGGKLIDWSQSQSFGYNAMPTIQKYGDRSDGGYARRYRVKIEAKMPADNVNTSFRRYSWINVAYSPSRRRTVTISGTYTANGTTAARAQYQASFDTYATAVLNGLGGTYKKLEEPQGTADDQAKEINFSVSYEEILYTGVGAADSSLRGEQLTVTRSKNSPGDTPANGTVERLIQLSAVYEAWFDNTQTLDLKGKWNTYRGAVIQEIQNTLSGGSLAVVGESPSFDFVNNKINVRLECVGSTQNGFLEYQETVTTDIFTGNILVGVIDGRPFSKYPYIGPGKWQVTIRQDFTQISGGDPPLFQSDALTPPNGFQIIQISSHRDDTPIRYGIPGSTSIDATRTSKVRVFEFYQEPQNSVATPGGGGGGNVVTPGTGGGGGQGTPVPTISSPSTPPGVETSMVPSTDVVGTTADVAALPASFFLPANSPAALPGISRSIPK